MPSTRVAREITLQELLAVEDDPRLLEFSCAYTGVPLWTTIRNPFHRLLMSDLVFSSPLVEPRRGASFRSDRIGALLAMARTFLHNGMARSRLRAPILLTTGSAGLQRRDGRWFNRLTDYFACEFPDRTVVLEDLFKWRWRVPRHHPNVFFHTPFHLLGQASGRLRTGSRLEKEAVALVGLLRERARRILGWEMGEPRRAFLEKLLAREAAAMPAMSSAYRRLFERLGVQLAVKEMGCYGRSAVFNATARDMGVVVAENQHGLVSAGHDAYNFAPSLVASPAYRHALPEFFLTYGEWWGEQINAPVQRVVIGNPHRTEQLRRLGAQEDPHDVLLLGDGIRTEAYLRLARDLKNLVRHGRKVVFRPHPQERAKVCAAFPDGTEGVQIDQRQDIYESFATAAAVVSEASTGLFEAVGIVERIVVLETSRGRFSLPRHPFVSGSSAEELAARIDDDSAGRIGPQEVRRIWEPGWRDHYRAFVVQHGRIESASQAV